MNTPDRAARRLVAHVVPADIPRGAQKQLRSLIDEMAEDDQRHRVLCIFGPRGSTLRPDISLGVESGVLRRAGFDPIAFVRLNRVLRRLEPSLVVAHGSEALKYLALTGKLGYPLVYHRIGLGSHKLRNPLRHLLQRSLIRKVRAVVAVSHDALADVKGFHPPDSTRLAVIPNSRDPSEFVPTDSRVEPAHLIFIGALVSSKRPDLFLEVVRRLRDEGLHFQATMAGDGPLRPSLEPHANKVDVKLLGPRHDIPELMRAASLLLFTSIAEGEGLPGVLIEAGLSGLPVVTTDVPGARSAILDGQTGFIVSIDDPETMVARVRRLLLDPGLRTRMGAEARVHCLTHFTAAEAASKWQTLIHELIPAS